MSQDATKPDPLEALPPGPNDGILDERVQELTWALLDEYASDDDIALLDSLLVSDDKARYTYVGCVQLHSELFSHFALQPQDSGKSANRSAVLSCLDGGLSTLAQSTPSVENS